MKSIAAELTAGPKMRGGGEGLACPICGGNSQVIDSRKTHLLDGVETIRRRRMCKANRKHRFTSYEIVANVDEDGLSSKRPLFQAIVRDGVAAELQKLAARYAATDEPPTQNGKDTIR